MKIRAWVVAVLLCVACPAVAAAQPEVDASRIYLGLSGSTLTFLTGIGSPEGVTTAPVNSQYYDITTGLKWRKATGSGNTGWTVEISLTPCSTGGQFVRSTGSAWGCSTLVLPNAIAQGELIYGSTTNVASAFAVGTAGQVLRTLGAGSAPAWSTATYPGTAGTAGTILRSDGTNIVNSTPTYPNAAASASYLRGDGTNWIESTLKLPNSSTAYRLLFSSATNTVSDETAGGMVQSDAGFSAKAYGVSRYGAHLYADAYGSARLDATDSTGKVWIPIEMRGSAFNIRSSATVYGDATIAGNLLPDVANTRSIGSITKPWLTIDVSEFRARTIVAQDVMSTIGGVLNILPTSALTADVGTGDLSITVKHNLFAVGDVVWLQKFGQFEAMRIAGSATGGTGLYIYLVDRNIDASGANAWVTGDGVQNTGTTGDGMIEMYATSGVTSGTVGPTIVGNVRTGTDYNAMAPRWAIGNLTGTYGYTATSCTGSLPCYGVALGDTDAAWVKVDPDNGVRMGHGANTNVSINATTGVASFLGVVADGATLGGFNIGTDYVRDVANTFGLASTVSGSDDVRFWAGAAFADRATAPARITETGVATFTNVTVTGAVNATSGSITGDFTVGTSGLLRSGATNYSTGTGWVLDYNSGTPRFRVGTTAGNRFAWDGTDLTLVSETVTIDDDGITVTPQPSGSTYSSDASYKFGANFGMFGLVDDTATSRVSVRSEGADVRVTELWSKNTTDTTEGYVRVEAGLLDSSIRLVATSVLINGNNTESKTCNTASNFTVIEGLVTSCTSVDPNEESEVVALRREVDALRRMLESVVGKLEIIR